MARFAYREWVLEELDRHGIRPRERTPPELVRELLNDLYRLELRQLRSRLVAEERRTGGKHRRAYSGEVVALRRRYALLSQPVETWAEAE